MGGIHNHSKGNAVRRCPDQVRLGGRQPVPSGGLFG